MREQTGNKERIGILGGTFDPIHLGHLIIAEQARDQYELDRVLLIPSGHSYFKDNRSKKVQSAQVRLRMTQIAAEGYAPFEVSDIEVNRPGNTYSFETLEELKANNPDAELFFIVGADTVCAMRTWREPARIFAVCTILAAMREDQVNPERLREETLSLERDFGARIRLLDVPNVGFSSTDIKNRLEEGRSVRYMLPEGVIEYIRSKGLYV